MNEQNMPENELERKQETLPWTLRDLLAIFFLTAGTLIGIEVIFSLFKVPALIERSGYASLMTLGLFLLQEAVLLALTFFYTLKKYKSTFKDFQFRWIGFFRTFGWALFGLLLFFGISIAIRLLLTALNYELPGFAEQEPYLPLFGQDPFSLTVAGLVIVGIAPFAEEIIFRGYLLQVLAKYRGNTTGIILAAIIFALLHFQLETLIPLFLLGVILNVLFLRTKSIWPSVLFHMLNNAIAFSVEILSLAGK